MTDDRSQPDPAQGPEHDVEIFHRLVHGERTCMMTTRDDEGTLYSRPMAVQQREDSTVWFLTYADSAKLDQLGRYPQVNLVFVDGDTWVSASGTGQVVHDVAKKQQLWNPFAQAWFQCEPEDPAVALLRVDLTGGQYWDSPSKPAQLLGVAKSLLTGSRPGGDNAKLDLS